MFMLKKPLFITSISLVLLLSLIGCNAAVMISGNSLNHTLTYKYKMFTGTKSDKLMIRHGESLILTYDMFVKDGNLQILIRDPDHNIIFDKSFDSSDVDKDLSIHTEKPGQYSLFVEGEKARGSFLVQWSAVEKKP